MNWNQIGILYRRELRSALRERTIVVNGILIPIFMYPIMLWAIFTGMTFVQGINEGFVSRVAVENAPPERHAALLDTLRSLEGVQLLGVPDDDGGDFAENLGSTGDAGESPTDWRSALASGEVDAVVSFRALPGDALEGNFAVDVQYDRAEERSRRAESRVRRVVADYRADWVASEGEARTLTEADRTVFAVVGENVSSSEDIGQLLLGQMLSFFLVIMVALGCFVPSIDTTAGERERSTWETLMTVSASRTSIVTAKYLYVATLGIVAGLLNVVAMMVSMGAVVRPLLAGTDDAITFSIPWLAAPVMLAGAIALALFFSAAMMILAAFARSFKDGQAMITPVYWLVFIPILLGDQSDVNLSLGSALIPIGNITMMIRDAIGGVFLWEWIAVTLLFTLALVALLLLLARQILKFEDFLLGAFDGSFWRFAKDKLFA
ncbi:MAG: ABC transporter permease subunit [Longimicrobiales bacterium]|nr:ABC transporter permease subunit [Longimicrobiales bacterium]